VQTSLYNSSIIENSPDWTYRGFLDSAPDPARYDGTTADPDNSAYKIAQFIPRGARVLDVGCGSGSFAQILQELSNCEAVIGVEPDAARAAAARARGMQVYQGNLTEEMVALIGSFDVIVFADVLEHLAGPASLLLLATRALKPGGKILISVPNVGHWSTRFGLLCGKFAYEQYGIMDATHLRWFTKASIVKFLSRVGYDVVAMDYTMLLALRVYQEMVPWKWVPNTMKRQMLRPLIRWFPGLFACQIIVDVRPRT
jgi:methionine biosynthesis protein MetW